MNGEGLTPQKGPEWEQEPPQKKATPLGMALLAATLSWAMGGTPPAKAAKTEPQHETGQKAREADLKLQQTYHAWQQLRALEMQAFKDARQGLAGARERLASAKQARAEFERAQGMHVLAWLQWEAQEGEEKRKLQDRETFLAEDVATRFIGLFQERDRVVVGQNSDAMSRSVELAEILNAGKYAREGDGDGGVAEWRIRRERYAGALRELMTRFFSILGARRVLDATFWDRMRAGNYGTLYQEVYSGLWDNGKDPTNLNELTRIYELLQEIEGLTLEEREELFLRMETEASRARAPKVPAADDTETL